jgi:hypothetical protein
MSSTIPKKGDIIINPKTSRPVKIGSRTWLKLVKEGLVEGLYTDPNELYNVQEGDNIEEKIEMINKELPRNQQSVRGRGKYAGKIVKRNKQPTLRETAQYSAKAASRAVSDVEVYDDLVANASNQDDFETQLENMILAEMIGGSQRGGSNQRGGKPPTTPCRGGRMSVSDRRQTAAVRSQEEQYYEQPPQEYDEESDEDYYN